MQHLTDEQAEDLFLWCARAKVFLCTQHGLAPALSKATYPALPPPLLVLFSVQASTALGLLSVSCEAVVLAALLQD